MTRFGGDVPTTTPTRKPSQSGILISSARFKSLNNLISMEALLDLTKDIWDFMRVRKKYWLAPLIITLVLMGALLVFTQGSVVAPFIYSIF